MSCVRHDNSEKCPGGDVAHIRLAGNQVLVCDGRVERLANVSNNSQPARNSFCGVQLVLRPERSADILGLS